MAIIKTNEVLKVELEGDSKNFLFYGIECSDLIKAFLDSRKEQTGENKWQNK